jgi:hypothetical protein
MAGKVYIKISGDIPNNHFVQVRLEQRNYTYGIATHRMAKSHVRTIWAHEHGPQGGDEINIIKKREQITDGLLLLMNIDYDTGT